VEVLFEEKVKGRWRGRTPTNKLVFVESEEDLRGRIISVQITWAGPWSMQARRIGLQGGVMPVRLPANLEINPVKPK
jgi:tRNA A37 methylthiotransferase MiaB